MNFFKKIMINGVFNTMIDENIDINARKIAWFIVTLLYLLCITAEILLLFLYDLTEWKIIISCFLFITAVLLVRLYFRLFLHLRKMKKKAKKEAIEKELRLKAQLKAEEEANPDHVYKT